MITAMTSTRPMMNTRKQASMRTLSMSMKSTAPGRIPADAYVPYLLTVFLFVLVMNVFGLIPVPRARRRPTSM